MVISSLSCLPRDLLNRHAAENTNEISRAVIRDVSLCARFLYLRRARARDAVNHMARARARARFSERE